MLGPPSWGGRAARWLALELATPPGSGRLGAQPPGSRDGGPRRRLTASVGEGREMAKKKHKQQQLQGPVSSSAASREAGPAAQAEAQEL